MLAALLVALIAEPIELDVFGQLRTQTGLYSNTAAEAPDLRMNLQVYPSLRLLWQGPGHRLEAFYHLSVFLGDSEPVVENSIEAIGHYRLSPRWDADAVARLAVGEWSYARLRSESAFGTDTPGTVALPELSAPERIALLRAHGSVGLTGRLLRQLSYVGRFRGTGTWAPATAEAAGSLFAPAASRAGAGQLKVRVPPKQLELELVNGLRWAPSSQWRFGGDLEASVLASGGGDLETTRAVGCDPGGTLMPVDGWRGTTFVLVGPRAVLDLTPSPNDFNLSVVAGGVVAVQPGAGAHASASAADGSTTDPARRQDWSWMTVVDLRLDVRGPLPAGKRARYTVSAGIAPYVDPFLGTFGPRATLAAAAESEVLRGLALRLSVQAVAPWSLEEGLQARPGQDDLWAAVLAEASQRFSENIQMQVGLRAGGRWGRRVLAGDPNADPQVIICGPRMLTPDLTVFAAIIAGFGLWEGGA